MIHYATGQSNYVVFEEGKGVRIARVGGYRASRCDPFHTRARARGLFTVVFYGSKIFGRKTAQLSETLRESVYSGSASENGLRNVAG